MPTNPPILPQGLPPHIAQSALNQMSSMPPQPMGGWPGEAGSLDERAFALHLIQARRRLLLGWVVGGIVGIVLAVGPLVWVLVMFWLR